jgi:hypothetical protein
MVNVPSGFVFASIGLAALFSSKNTEAPATGSPAELRTVPLTVIASCDCGGGFRAAMATGGQPNNSTAAEKRVVASAPVYFVRDPILHAF